MALLFSLLVAACESETGVKSATGDTPVKYVICGAGERNCFVAARFKDLDACASHKQWSEMLCDSRSTPGEMTCRKDLGPMISVAYCTL
jgi:hypothetical protein